MSEHTSPLACSRCNPLECACACHCARVIPPASPAPVSRVQAIEAAEDHADQVIFDAWRERGL